MERLAGRIILLWGWRRAAVAFLAGALAVLSQAPFDFFAAGFISFPVLVWLLDGASVSVPGGMLRRFWPAFVTGWWFGFGYFLGGVWWIGTALLVEAESFAWALPFAVVGIPVLLAMFYGLATVLARLMWSNNIGRVAALAFGFGVAEWLRGMIFTGFPWNAVGYAAMPMPLLMQSASVVGMIGMNALAVFVFAMPGLLAARRDRAIGLALAAVLCLAHAGFGYWNLLRPIEPDGRTLAVRIVQPAVAMSEKWDAAAQDRVFTEMLEASARPPDDGAPVPQLILWPETSVPFLFSERPDALAAIGALLADGQVLLAGAVRSEGGSAGQAAAAYYNAVVAIDHDGEIADAVDKVHLVPFGEYLPFAAILERLGLDRMVAGPMNFAAGAARHPIALPDGIMAVPFICFEIIFPELVAVDAARADIIVNVTNDGWFGNTPGPYQHFRQAQVRAVETGLPLVRAANTGISAIIDQRGRIVDALALGVNGVIDGKLVLASPSPPLPRHLVGLAIVAFFGFLGFLMRFRQRVQAN